jgi:hypothetical protein
MYVRACVPESLLLYVLLVRQRMLRAPALCVCVFAPALCIFVFANALCICVIAPGGGRGVSV